MAAASALHEFNGVTIRDLEDACSECFAALIFAIVWRALRLIVNSDTSTIKCHHVERTLGFQIHCLESEHQQ